MGTLRDDLLVWVDLEMSGLDPERERILELAVILTDGNLEHVADGPELVLHQPDELLDAMDAWNTSHHTESGLVERVRHSTLSEAAAEEQVLAFLVEHCVPDTARLAGNSIWQDRRFLERAMPRLLEHLHYRLVDVSTVKELARLWRPALIESAPKKEERHRALEDIRESIAELKHYKAELFA